MKIPGNPLLNALGPLRQPQAGSNRQINPQLQTKANAAGPLRGRAPAEAPAATARKGGQAAGPRPGPARPQAAAGSAPGLARAQNLEQAVQALADQERLPPRGSLIDLSA